MKMYAPVPPQEAIQVEAVPHLATQAPARLLVLDNGRVAGQPLLEALAASLGQSVHCITVEKRLVASGSSLDLVTEAARSFSAVIVGVGD